MPLVSYPASRRAHLPAVACLIAVLLIVGQQRAGASIAQGDGSKASVVAPADLARRGGIDLDGNGKSAIVLRNNVSQLLALRWVDGQFQATQMTDPGPSTRILAIADIDGNGKSDLLFQSLTQTDPIDLRIWADFQPATERVLRRVKRDWVVQSVGDLDGDGFTDLAFRFVGNSDAAGDKGVSFVWFTDGSNVTQVRKRGGAPLDWTLLGAADLNGDGAADLVYISPTNDARALFATPKRNCENVLIGALPRDKKAIALADFTGDRRGDILMLNPSSGAVQVWSLDATGVSLEVDISGLDDPSAPCAQSHAVVGITSYALPSIDPSWQFWAAGDFNGDGVTDIVWKRPDGTLTLWLLYPNAGNPTVVTNAGKVPVGYEVVPAFASK